MSYTAYIESAAPWLVIEYEGAVDQELLIAARAEAAAINGEGDIRDFILDFSEVTEFVLAPEGVERIGEIDRARAAVLKGGRCAIVAQRETVELGTTLLGTVSPLDLDFRVFQRRADAEAWLRGDLATPPPPLPRSSRRERPSE